MDNFKLSKFYFYTGPNFYLNKPAFLSIQIYKYGKIFKQP